MLQPQTNAAEGAAMLQPNLQNAAGQVPMVLSFQPENNMMQPNQPGMLQPGQPNQPGMLQPGQPELMQPNVGQSGMLNPTSMNNQVSLKVFLALSRLYSHCYTIK